MWFDSLLEAVQAAQDYHENIDLASWQNRLVIL
jgi:hypothetical protein